MAGGQMYREYQNRFQQKASDYKGGPVQQRQCRDICCLVTFVLIFLLTLGAGIYFIIGGRESYAQLIESTNQEDLKSFSVILGRIAPVLVGMLVLSSILSIIYVFLAKTFPKCVTYTMIGLTFIVYIGLIIVGIVFKIYALAIVFGIALLINALMLWCYWGYINIGIKLLEVAGTFITEKPAVYFISLMCLLLNALYTIFWIFSWVGVSAVAAKSSADDSTYTILSYVWIADGVFFGYFLYYNMVFLIAMACAFWYYQNKDNSVMRGFNYIKYQLGPITFASIVITVITIMRILASSQSSGNGCIRICACIVTCILRCIEQLVKVLNHNSVIVMAVTGEGYIDSAKSAIGLIFDNFGLFIIVDFFTEFMELYSMIFCVFLPAIIGGIILYLTAPLGLEMNDAIWGGIIILLLALLISEVILGMLAEVLSCIFIFYSFDCKFRAMGIPVNNIPPQIKNIFDEANHGPQAQQASLNRLN